MLVSQSQAPLPSDTPASAMAVLCVLPRAVQLPAVARGVCFKWGDWGGRTELERRGCLCCVWVLRGKLVVKLGMPLQLTLAECVRVRVTT